MAQEKAAVIDRDKYDYDSVRTVGADGKARTSTGKNDAVARAMLWVAPDKVRGLLKANGLTDREQNTANFGLFRMSVGNSLRAAVKRYMANPKGNDPVTIGDHVIKSLDQKVPIPEAPAKAPAQKASADDKKAAKGATKTAASSGSRGKASASRGKGSGRQTAGSSTTNQTA